MPLTHFLATIRAAFHQYSFTSFRNTVPHLHSQYRLLGIFKPTYLISYASCSPYGDDITLRPKIRINQCNVAPGSLKINTKNGNLRAEEHFPLPILSLLIVSHSPLTDTSSKALDYLHLSQALQSHALRTRQHSLSLTSSISLLLFRSILVCFTVYLLKNSAARSARI